MSRGACAVLGIVVLFGGGLFVIHAGAQAGQAGSASAASPSNDIFRRAKTRVQPEYPDLARKMALSGAVKIEVTVAPNGTVRSARVVGGHPVLAGAALDAARKWRFEPAPIESSGVIEFKFEAPH